MMNPFENDRKPPTTAMVARETERAATEVKASLVIARGNPRDVVRSVDLILQDCTRLRLAEKAEYEFARGGTDIRGPTIYLMQTVARRWGNLKTGIRELSRHEGVSECEAFAWDLETNYYESRTFQVRHWRDTKKGGYELKDERDIYELISNYGQRRKRACIEAVVPADVVDAAMAQIAVTLKKHLEVTPARIKEMVDLFGKIGVTKSMLEARVQRRIDAISPALLGQLGRIYNSIRDGIGAVEDFFDLREEIKEPKAKQDHEKAEPNSPEPVKNDFIADIERAESAPRNNATVSQAQIDMIRKQLEKYEIPENVFEELFGPLADLGLERFGEVQQWMRSVKK